MANKSNKLTIPVRITRKRYAELHKISLAEGMTITWQMNYAVDLYLAGRVERKEGAGK